MAFEGSGIDRRPLLPESVEERLRGGLSRLVAVTMLLLAVAGWISLLTWSALDPSLTHAAGRAPRNWLGPVGAIASDLLLQTVGLAAIFALIVPTFWGGELLLRQRLVGLKSRALFAPVAVLVLAAAFAALPPPASWPLHHGLGGMLGGVLFKLLAGVFATINPARAGLAAGLILFAGGMCFFSAALGLTQREYALLWQPADVERGAQSAFGRWLVAWRTRGDVTRAPAREVTILDPQPPPLPGEQSLGGPLAGARDADDEASRIMAERFAPGPMRLPPEPQSPPPPPPRPVARVAPRGFKAPPLSILRRPPPSKGGNDVTQAVLRGNARLLEDTLADFGVKGAIKDMRPGPVVTLYELEPARGTKSSRVIALADDIARSMSAISARVAVVPGRNALGIELPNATRETVYLRELLETEAWRRGDAKLPIVLGKTIGGDPVVVDLARMPHLLVAGTTGSGKSVGVNGMILSLLYRLSPSECRMMMIDPKMLELSVYNGIPHLLTPVVTDPHKAAAALNWAVAEMEERYKRMSKLGVRGIEMFNARVREAGQRGERLARRVQTGFDPRTGEPVYETEALDYVPMPYIVIVVDEFADLMVVAGKEVEGAVQRLAQMARAAGIHLIMATQRPSVDVITGTIKANFPTRISFKVASRIDSRTILNEQGAEQLLGAGDMLFAATSGSITRVHGPFVSDEEVEQVAGHLRAQGEPVYVEIPALEAADAADDEDGEGPASSGSDDLFDRAVALVVRDQKASTSYIQRRLSIGYNRAADLIERMEREGLISAADRVGKRHILMGGGGPGRGAPHDDD